MNTLKKQRQAGNAYLLGMITRDQLHMLRKWYTLKHYKEMNSQVMAEQVRGCVGRFIPPCKENFG